MSDGNVHNPHDCRRSSWAAARGQSRAGGTSVIRRRRGDQPVPALLDKVGVPLETLGDSTGRSNRCRESERHAACEGISGERAERSRSRSHAGARASTPRAPQSGGARARRRRGRAEDIAALRALLAQGADPNVPQADGATALHWAVPLGRPRRGGRADSRGAKVDAVNDLGVFSACRWPARTAARRWSNGCSRECAHPADAAKRRAGADVVRADRHGDALRALWRAAPMWTRASVRRGQTALMWAAAGRHAGAVKVLIERGADLNAVSTADHPLMFAPAKRCGVSEGAGCRPARESTTRPRTARSALVIAAASVAGLTARDYRLVAEHERP